MKRHVDTSLRTLCDTSQAVVDTQNQAAVDFFTTLNAERRGKYVGSCSGTIW